MPNQRHIPVAERAFEDLVARELTRLIAAIPPADLAMYCGFGRQPGADGTETMREHARVVRAALNARRP